MNSYSSDQSDLIYMKKNYPHLYDIEMQILRVIDQSGYGDVSVSLTINNGVVEKAEILGSSRRLYYRRVKNKLVRLDEPLDVDGKVA